MKIIIVMNLNYLILDCVIINKVKNYNYFKDVIYKSSFLYNISWEEFIFSVWYIISDENGVVLIYLIGVFFIWLRKWN